MPKLSKEQLAAVKYVSIQDYCRRVDEEEKQNDVIGVD